MLKHLLKFEWSFYNRKWSFYVMLFAFFAIGFIITLANFSPPNMNKNSPYVLASLIGLLSLATVFSTTLLAAQSLLKEIETKFDAIIYATPLKKVDHLASRFIVLFILSVFSFFLLVVGIVVGLQMPWVNQEQMGSFNLWHYLQPFLFVVIPNIFLCSALVSALAWTTKNKLIIYVGGLLIYVLYMVGSVFSNSPIMAGASPASPEAISWAARLDPFGLASLFEQTTNWSAVERNTHVVELKGNFLINRVLWMSVSVFTLVIAYLKFGFKVSDGKKGKQGLKVPKKQSKQNKQPRPYAIAQQKPGTQKHQWQTLISFTKLDLTTILKGIPFILILIIWTFFLGMEMQGAIDGGIRISSFYAETGIILNTILETLPFFALTVMLFYSSEVLGRSKSVFMAELENSTPLNPSMVFFSKLISLSVITLLLIAYSIFIGVVLQVIYQYPIIDWGLYMSLFYLLGLPIVLCTVLAMGIQVIVNNKYLGLTLASIIILLTNSALGRLIGLRHLLFRFANPMPDIYADMNGFGNYISAFHWRMLYATALAVLIGLVASLLWNRNKSIWNTLKGLRLNLFQKSVLWLSVFVFLLFRRIHFLPDKYCQP